MVGDRALIEDAVTLLLEGVPAGWTHVHGEFDPLCKPALAAVSVVTPHGQSSSIGVPAGVLGVLAEHQRRAAAAGVPWRRLILDCHSDGRLAVRSEPTGAPSRRLRPRRWLIAVMAALAVGCLAAAAIVFAASWRWAPPPRVELMSLPDPPPRQQESFEVIGKWYEAQNRGDVVGMWAVTCANPSAAVRDRIAGVAERSGLVFPDAIVAFSDQGGQVWAGVVLRIRPLDDAMKLDVERAQREDNGYFGGQFTLLDEAGGLKICDQPTGPHE